jgi:subtilisin-like proprotein convertase family protein
MLAAVAALGWLGRGGAGWPGLALAGGTIPEVCPIYQSSDVPKAIPDNNPSGVNSALVINAPGQRITNVSVRLNSILHTFVGDLRIRLIAPNGAEVVLIGNPGVIANDGDNFYGTTLDDKFATSILNGVAPFTGGYRPTGTLAVLRGLHLSGAWQLNVADVTAADTGLIEAWSMEVCSLPDRLWMPVILR